MLLWCQVQVKIQKRETNVELQGPAATTKIQKSKKPTRFVFQFLQAPHHHFETHQSLKIFFSAGWYDGPDDGPIYRVYWSSWTKCSNGVKYKSRYVGSLQKHSPQFCQEGHLSCVLSLIQAGASTIIPNTDGNFPIHIASAANRAAVVWVLVNHGSDKDQASNN